MHVDIATLRLLVSSGGVISQVGYDWLADPYPEVCGPPEGIKNPRVPRVPPDPPASRCLCKRAPGARWFAPFPSET